MVLTIFIVVNNDSYMCVCVHTHLQKYTHTYKHINNMYMYMNIYLILAYISNTKKILLL